MENLLTKFGRPQKIFGLLIRLLVSNSLLKSS